MIRCSVCFGIVLALSVPGGAFAQASANKSKADASDEGPAPEEYTREVKLAVEAYNRDEFAKARQHFARAHELRPSARTWRGLGTTAFELKFYEDAVRELTFALEDRRGSLTDKLRTETELTLRVAQRRLKESDGKGEVAANRPPAPRPELAPVPPPAAAELPVMPAPAASTEPTSDEPPGLGTQRIVALAVGAAGVVGIGIGVGFGLKSMSKGDERDRLCPKNGVECTAEGAEAADAAITAGNISTVAWAVGGAALVGGVVLWLTGAPVERETARHSGLQWAVSPGGVKLKAAF